MSRKEDATRRKLVDRIVPRIEDGPILAFLATTYELQPEFFETDFLPSVLGVGALDDRSWTTRVAIERQLQAMEAAALFLDAHRYQTRPLSFRIDVQPVALTNGAAFHPKVSLFVHDDVVRLVVGSANLTDPGYRRNREAITLLRASTKEPNAAPLIGQAITGMRTVLSAHWSRPAELVCKNAEERLQKLGTADPEGTTFVWSGPRLPPLWTRFLDAWPSTEQVETISIVSPFWTEEEGDRGPVTSLLAAMKERAMLKTGAALRLLTEARADRESTYRPVLPASFAKLDLNRRFDVRAVARSVDPTIDREEVDAGIADGFRALHAKIVVFESKSTALAYVGSANFTAPGWGFAVGHENVEAGVIVLHTGRDRSSIRALLPPTIGDPVDLAGAATGKLASPVAPEPEKPWPRFLRAVELRPARERPGELELSIELVPDAVAGVWQVAVNRDVLARGDMGGEPQITVTLPSTIFEELLRIKEVTVRWWATDAEATYPINVSLDARAELPLFPGAAAPSEHGLLAYYQGRITWEELFPEISDGRSPPTSSVSLVEEQRVDTSRIQSYQVREFVEALKGIEEALKAASTVNPAAMQMAVMGPVSPVALARQVFSAAQSSRRSPIAAGFQLVELIGCLGRARQFAVEGPKGDAWRTMTSRAIAEVERLLESLRQSHAALFAGDTAFQRYASAIAPMIRVGGGNS